MHVIMINPPSLSKKQGARTELTGSIARSSSSGAFARIIFSPDYTVRLL